MKKLLVLLLALPFLSCSFASYVFENKTQAVGVDFSKGKWLLNQVDVPPEITKKLTALSKEDFGALIGDRLVYIPESSGIMLPQKKVIIDPSKYTLQDIYKSSSYDFFINIKAAITSNDFGALDTTPNAFRTGDNRNSSYVTIQIYNLRTSEVIYSQKVIAIVRQGRSSTKVTVAKPQYNLILASYKKLMKDIVEKSVK